MNVYRINKINIIIGASLAAFALIFSAISIVMLVRWVDFKKTALSTEALITNIRREKNHHVGSDSANEYDYYVTVLYTVDGVEYNRLLGYYTSSMREGQYVTVYYDPDDPNQIMNNPSFFTNILMIFIFATGVAGFWILISEAVNRKLINGLAAEDKYIVCDHSVERIEVISNITVNSVRYMQTDFIYHAQDGNEYVFSSRPYHPNKNPFIDGENVIVYVDIEKNPKKYYVSTDR